MSQKKKKRERLDKKTQDRIRALVKAGKNQREVAKTIGIAQSSVSRWVNFNRPPKNPRKKVKKPSKRRAMKVKSPSKIGARDASTGLNGSGVQATA